MSDETKRNFLGSLQREEFAILLLFARKAIADTLGEIASGEDQAISLAKFVQSKGFELRELLSTCSDMLDGLEKIGDDDPWTSVQ